MGNELDASFFNDAEQLGNVLTDSRAADSKRISSVVDALDIVEIFRSNDSATPWIGLDREQVARRLAELANDPRAVRQGRLNLCGPASLICMWTSRDPVGFVTFATELFDNGKSSIGSLAIEPSSELVGQDFNSIRDQADTHGADWMVLGAIRNTTNVFWQGEWVGDPDQELAALTRPEELAEWLSATGIYATVRNEGNWVSPAGVPHASGIEMFEGRDVALLIHVNLLSAAKGNALDHSFLVDQFPNHYVVALNSPTIAVMNDPEGRFREGDVQLSVWTWGNNENLDLAVPRQQFIDNYYGAIIADLY